MCSRRQVKTLKRDMSGSKLCQLTVLAIAGVDFAWLEKIQYITWLLLISYNSKYFDNPNFPVQWLIFK